MKLHESLEEVERRSQQRRRIVHLQVAFFSLLVSIEAGFLLRSDVRKAIDAEVHNIFAYLHAVRDGASEATLRRQLQQAIRANDLMYGKNPHILDTVACLHFRLGELEAAEKYANAAVRLSPRSKVFLARLDAIRNAKRERN